jgi:hypothetical protein
MKIVNYLVGLMCALPILSGLSYGLGVGGDVRLSTQSPVASTVRIVSGDFEDGLFRGQTSGAGVIITADGAVLTTRQAILTPDGQASPVLWAMMYESSDRISLNRAVRLKVLAVNAELDLALLQLSFRPGRDSAVPFVKFAVDDQIDYGARVSLHSFSTASGSSVVRRQSAILDFDERHTRAGWIIVDGRIDPLSTGGPVFNEQGRLIGIQTSVRQNRQVPFFGDDDFPIGLVNVGEVGYVRSLQSLIGFLLDPAAAHLQFSPPARPVAVQVTGRVRDAKTGEPVPGAVIGIIVSSEMARTSIITARELVGYGRSNLQGQFEASRRVSPARYLVKVVHPQYQTIVKEVTIGSDQQELTIEMVRNQ